MRRLLGTETEYGILVEGQDAGQLVGESMELVRAYPGRYGAPWDYRTEDPRRDLRGYRVRELTRSPDDENYRSQDSQAPPLQEQRSDRILSNGARLYNDHGHPEYSTPECASVLELVAHDRAGERILLECTREREKRGSGRIRLYKNNTDFHGVSYGTHENYLARREIPFEQLLAGLLPFFITRQVYAGAGKVGVEADGAAPGLFQLSQRADFFTEVASVDTLHRRPIVNTRDEPHADASRYRRLHVICGDANPSEFATALKVGATELALSLVEEGWQPGIEVREPVRTIKEISRDQSLRWPVELTDGTRTTAVEVQGRYLAEAKRRYTGRDAETNWLLMAWETVLQDLAEEPSRLADRLDWVAKRHLLEAFRESEGLSWEDPLMQSLDLEYHNIDPAEGLYWGLLESGEMRRVVGEQDVLNAQRRPPANTRAFLRGLCIERFGDAVAGVTWGRVWLRHGGHEHRIDLTHLADGAVGPAIAAARDARTVPDLVSRLAEAGRSSADR